MVTLEVTYAGDDAIFHWFSIKGYAQPGEIVNIYRQIEQTGTKERIFIETAGPDGFYEESYGLGKSAELRLIMFSVLARTTYDTAEQWIFTDGTEYKLPYVSLSKIGAAVAVACATAVGLFVVGRRK